MQPIPVVRAEAYYKPRPARPGVPAEDWSHIPVAERVFSWYLAWLGRRVAPPAGTLSDAFYARIDHNRWLTDCICGNAQIISPTDPRAACPECRYGWVTLIFPADPAAVEAEMMQLPALRDRFWWNPDDPKNPYRPEPPEPLDQP
ncbi:hypothetical protein [Streptomyces jumonjinensis]|uniref:Uncharacterized protein n=1 Tax=Streptomyces jumonjinensis TaxID=1945 RepID=A0A646KLJ4_STRJU|nr:hypothetical protein [Streptomyces jumonjinensis]MQT03182.1 hypothetical protein [Streptomyces jumonjinensis]